MSMNGYPQDLPGVMKLLDIYIAESFNNRNFGKISTNEHTVVVFRLVPPKISPILSFSGMYQI